MCKSRIAYTEPLNLTDLEDTNLGDHLRSVHGVMNERRGKDTPHIRGFTRFAGDG